MIETLEYLKKSLKQNLAVVLWIDSNLFIFDKVWGSQTDDKVGIPNRRSIFN